MNDDSIFQFSNWTYFFLPIGSQYLKIPLLLTVLIITINSYPFEKILRKIRLTPSLNKNAIPVLKMIEGPLLVLVGGKNEAIVAEEYPVVFKSYSNGDCYLIEDETHNGIRHNPEAF